MALIIAAPINSADIDNWIELQSLEFSPIVDLRDSAVSDPICSSQGVIELSELFASLNEERKRLEGRTAATREGIELLASRRARQQQWQAFEADDLCA